MFDSNPKIKMPLEIQNLWNDFGNWRYEVSFSLQGGRCVYKELFNEYQQITSLEGALNKITENEECLVSYRFYCDSLIPMFPIYADGKLLSRVSPRKFISRESRQGTYPWESKSDDTVFILMRFQKNDYYGDSEIRLISGGFNRENSVKNWKILNTEIKKIF